MKSSLKISTAAFAALMAASWPVHSASVATSGSAGAANGLTGATTGTASGQTNLGNSATNASGQVPMGNTGATVSGQANIGNSGTNNNASTSNKPLAAPMWTNENQYWRNQYPQSTYFSRDRNYTIYEPAYRYGFEAFNRNNGRTYDQLDQEQLRQGWVQARGGSSLNWDEAQLATRDAYMRLQNNRTVR